MIEQMNKKCNKKEQTADKREGRDRRLLLHTVIYMLSTAFQLANNKSQLKHSFIENVSHKPFFAKAVK